MKNVTIRCTGVPEHFNLPWKVAVEKKLFQAEGINVVWQDNESGTGAMCQSLREGDVDMAVLLTEGAVRDIHRGNPSKICSFYVDSPLIWGVHTSSNSNFTIHDFLDSGSFAISRFTSGSHLMACVYAKKHDVVVNEDSYKIINNLEGATKSLSENTNQLFLWEKFTTKPIVDAGLLKRIDECPTPWPAFVIVASENIINKEPDKVSKIISIVQKQAAALKKDINTIRILSERYGIQEEDAKEWFEAVQWSTNTSIDTNILNEVAQTLANLSLIDEIKSANDYIVQL